MSAPGLNLLNIPVGRPFFRTLVEALVAGEVVPAIHRRSDPLILSSATIFVPTRRSGDALRAELGATFGPGPVMLPRIVPLGDPANLDDRSILGPETTGGDESLPPAVPPLRRRLELMRLVEAWRLAIRSSLLADHGRGPLLDVDDLFQVAASPADAFGLAGDLASLIDEMTIEGIDWSALHGIVDGHDQYWDITARFLSIAGDAWPRWLGEQDLLDDAMRRRILLEGEACRLQRDRPSSPFIVVGSTGSQPATAELMKAIAMLPNGAVVLPGLDRNLDEASWQAIVVSGPQMAQGMGSPQAILKRFLEQRLGVTRADVRDLGAEVGAAGARATLISQMLRPAETTDRWSVEPTDPAHASRLHEIASALAGVTIIEAADEREEALAIAIRMRQAVHEQTGTVQLVTPDRALGLRVAAELARFGIAVEDSAGRPLAATPHGALAHQALALVEGDFAPAALLALLHHEYVRLGGDRASVDAMIAALDIGVLRGTGVKQGFTGLREAAKAAPAQARGRRAPHPQKRLATGLEDRLDALLSSIEAALMPLATAIADGQTGLCSLARLHRDALISLTRDETGMALCFEGADGMALERLFDALTGDETEPSLHGRGHDGTGLAAETYRPVFDALLAGESVRTTSPDAGRLRIYGPLEARLLDADLTILGGLNEGVWPPVARTDAFLNRPMRAAMGLSPPERRIGQSAHDFSMLMGMPEIVLTRAARVEGSPAIASRFVRRLKAYAGDGLWRQAVTRGDEYARFARLLDETPVHERPEPIARPEPKPPVVLRPVSLGITEIETLYRDPYAIHAKRILKLDALGDRLPIPSYGERGTLIHEALGQFIALYPGELPEQPLHRLIEIGESVFAQFDDNLDVQTFWWPRFKRIAAWFVDWEGRRRQDSLTPHVERDGRLEFTLDDGSVFVLRGRADRIDVHADGRVSIVDYKTGTPPRKDDVLLGVSPQLTLEAAMVRLGAFAGVSAEAGTRSLAYIKLTGSESEPGKEMPIDPAPSSPDDLADRHLTDLTSHLSRYRNADKGYLSQRIPKAVSFVNPYDHLARVLEWNGTAFAKDGDA